MADERKKEQEQEIQEILSDLDTILSGLGPAQAPAPSAEPLLAELPQAGTAPTAPPPAPAPVIAAPPSPPPASEPPPPPPPPAPVIAAPPLPAPEPPPPTPEPPAPAPAVIAPPPPPPAPAAEVPFIAVEPSPQSAPAAALPPPVLAEIPDKTPKNQIRRVAVIYAANYVKERDEFIKFLDKTAETLSKKPLYLRKVYVEIFNAFDNVKVFLEKMRASEVVAVLAIVEGLPEPKVSELSQVLSEAGLMFRTIPAADVKKKTVAMDLVVDMMLLACEA